MFYIKWLNKAKPTLDPGCLDAVAIARRAAGPRAVVPLSVNLLEKSKKIHLLPDSNVIIMSKND